MPILLTILGFLWWWPLGLLILAFLIARRGRMGCWRHPAYAWDAPMADGEHGRDRWERKMARLQEKMEMMRARMERVRGGRDWFGPSTSGNRAFDDYRSETLKRLEDEQREFKDFLGRLRFAKDRAEFDQFMAERRERPSEPELAPGRTGPLSSPSARGSHLRLSVGFPGPRGPQMRAKREERQSRRAGRWGAEAPSGGSTGPTAGPEPWRNIARRRRRTGWVRPWRRRRPAG